MNTILLTAEWLRAKFDSERGAGLAEYALLLFVIAMAAAIGVATFGDTVIGMFDDASTNIPVPAGP
jgi:Flp pilus assembly pilin Flp